MIPSLGPRLVRHREQGLDLIARQKAEDRLGKAFLRDRQNVSGGFRHLRSKEIAGVMDKGANGGEPGIAAASAVVAVFFQMGKKCENALGAAGLQGQLGGRGPAARLKESKKQAEGVAVSADSAGAEIAMGRDVFGKKPLKQAAEIWSFHGSGD